MCRRVCGSQEHVGIPPCMRFYPDSPKELSRTVAHDALALVALVALAWLGLKIHDAADNLAVLGTGVRDTGEGIEDGFRAAGDAVSGLPVVGDEAGDALRDAGAGTGGEVREAGQDGEERVHQLADLLGLVTFALPAALLLMTVLPGRIRTVRGLNAARRVLADPWASEERQRLIAMRAALSLPDTLLVRHTDDPLGDLEAGRYEPLIQAAHEHAGLRPSRRKQSVSDAERRE